MPSGLHRFQLESPPGTGKADRTRLLAIESALIRGLHERGYQESSPPQFRIAYRFETADKPFLVQTDSPPPSLLGPYQTVHLLHDQSGLLRIKWLDLNGNTLWEGLTEISLYPARQNHRHLKNAVDAMLAQMPTVSAPTDRSRPFDPTESR